MAAITFSTNLADTGLPTEVVTRGDNLGQNLEPQQEATRIQAGKFFTEVASSKETLIITKRDIPVKKENLGRKYQYALCSKRGIGDPG